MRRQVAAGAVVVVHAAAQAWSVAADPVPQLSGPFPVLALLSGLAAVLGLTAMTLLVVSASRPVVVLLAASATVVLALGASLISPLACALVLLAAGAGLPAAARGRAPSRGRVPRPVAAGGWAIAVIVLLALVWAVFTVAGLFMPGPWGAALAWLLGGAACWAVLGTATRSAAGPGIPGARDP